MGSRWIKGWCVVAVLGLGCDPGSDGGDEMGNADAGEPDGAPDDEADGPSSGFGREPQGERIDCTWFQSPDNCWVTATQAAAACAPAGIITDDPDIPNAVGVFDESRTACQYDDGTTIVYDTPVPDPDSPQFLPFADYDWGFEIRDEDGALCMRHTDEDRPFAVQLPEGAFTWEIIDLDVLQIECADGRQYYAQGLPELLACATSPGGGFFSAGNFVTYTLRGAGSEDAQMFVCR